MDHYASKYADSMPVEKMKAAFERITRWELPNLQRQSVLVDTRTARLPSDTPSFDDFDPREHRTPRFPITLTMAYFNLLRTLFGAGMLGIPLAISQAGMLFGTIMNLVTGVIMVYAHFNLLWCLNEISRQLRIPYVSYRYGFRIALLNGPRLSRTIGRHGPCIIATFMFLSQVGICTVFVIFTTDSLRDIMDWDSSRPALYCLYFPYTFLLFYMKNLKYIAYVSLAGNVMNLIGLFLVVYHMATSELPGNVVKFGNESPTALMFALGTMMFNMSAVAVILSIDKASPHPESLTKRCGVIEIGIIVPTILSTIFGCYGYYSFGTMEENILRSLPFDDDSAILAISLYMIAIMLAYPIQSFPGIEIALDVYKHLDIIEAGDEEVRLAGAILRPAFVFLTFLVAGLIPFQGPFVAFVGNSCTSLLALVFPAMMQLCIMYPGPYGPYNLYLIKNVFFIVLGLLMCTVGAGTCGYLIYIRMMYINAEE